MEISTGEMNYGLMGWGLWIGGIHGRQACLSSRKFLQVPRSLLFPNIAIVIAFDKNLVWRQNEIGKTPKMYIFVSFHLDSGKVYLQERKDVWSGYFCFREYVFHVYWDVKRAMTKNS